MYRDHVRKTAAYVNIIMESMREKGIYPDQVTDHSCRTSAMPHLSTI